MTPGDLVVIAVLVLVSGCSIRYLIKQKKKGGGCAGNCASCGCCGCHPQTDAKKHPVQK